MVKRFKVNHLILVIVLVMILFISTACQGTGNAAKAEEDVHVINITYPNNPGEPTDLKARKWKELAEERSNGRLQLNLYPSGQLGSADEILEMGIVGNNIIVASGMDFLAFYEPDIGIFDSPYLVDSLEEAVYLTKTDWFEELEGKLAEKGVAIVNANSPYGERHLMTKKEVKTPEDLKGMRIRVPNTTYYTRAFSALGASPTPVPLSELYASLQQGVVDGAENPLPVLEGANVHEVTNYLTLTGHTKVLNPWVTGTAVMDNLPDDLEEILKETGDEAGDYLMEILPKFEEEVLEEFEDAGIVINEIDEELFKEKSESFYEGMPGWSDGLHERVKGLLEEYRKNNPDDN